MVFRGTKVEVHIATVINMAVILLRADKRRLREESPVIVAARIFFAVGLPGDIGLFVATNALFTGPQWERFAAQIKVGKLFTAAVDMIFRLCGKAQPDAVVVKVVVL